jgi:hypothetical protein
MLLLSLAITVLCMLPVLLLLFLLFLLLLSAGEVGGNAWQQDPCQQHCAHGL